MPKRELVISVEIEASRELVWKVLTDLEAFSEWNPMIRRAEGRLRPGEFLRVRFQPHGSRGHDFKPRLTVVDPPRELRWTAFLDLPRIFHFEHYWILEEAGEGKTLLKHGVFVKGVLAPLVWKRVEESSRKPFEAMNLAHKQRAEELARQG